MNANILCKWLVPLIATIRTARSSDPRTHGAVALHLDGGRAFNAMVAAIGRAVRSRNKREGAETFEATCLRALAHIAAFAWMLRGTIDFVLWDFVHALIAEAEKSRAKYPQGGTARVSALAEELGELSAEIEQSLAARDITPNLWVELKQVGAMVYRLMGEGYPSEAATEAAPALSAPPSTPEPAPSPEAPHGLAREVVLADTLRSVLTSIGVPVALSLRVPPPLALEILGAILPHHGVGVQVGDGRIVLFSLVPKAQGEGVLS